MKIYITLAQAKLFYSMLDLLADNVRKISRKDVIEHSEVSKGNVAKIIQNRYLLEDDLTKNKNQNSTKGGN